MTPTMLSPLGARGSSSAMFGSWPMSALEMVPSASRADARAAISRDEEIARRAFCTGFPVPSVVRLGVGDCVKPQSSASRVVCRCREWPQAVCGCLQSAATLTNRSGEGASCCGPEGDELEAWPTRT
jgi:hypothetical protein